MSVLAVYRTASNNTTYSSSTATADIIRSTCTEPWVTHPDDGCDVAVVRNGACGADALVGVPSTAESVVKDLRTLAVPNEHELGVRAAGSEGADLIAHVLRALQFDISHDLHLKGTFRYTCTHTCWTDWLYVGLLPEAG